MAKRFDKTYKIISNKEICAGYFELKVKAGVQVIKACNPGQFFMISVPGVFLRRPISVHDAKNGVISFLYKIVGKGTKNLSQLQSGEISMLGPLGNGYPFLPSPLAGEGGTKSRVRGCFYPIIIAGGTGIASVHFLAVKLKNKGTLYYGAKTKKDLLCLDKFKKAGWKTIVSTEDGSQGHKGLITNILKEKITNYELRITNNKSVIARSRCDAAIQNMLYVCGPTPMMKAVFKIAKEKNISGYASLEEKMACGIGNCQGCAVKVSGKTKMTCKDGPVFAIEEIEI
ncbi:MAG: dihydroorotate dehydrogenase electron transfer subunit [Endomicrobia bacterium]|nr:dihydroorotate dehydrogenase electron transfer subunit [Endomicrobiia bacterium]MCL2798798.1 dihydroorotate dehydrogenase electron transfer subunit [Endomicrobiia bacterium]